MFMLLLIPALILLCIWWLVGAAHAGSLPQVLGAVFAIVVLAISLGGFFVVEPNQSTVLMMFGNYRGSERRPGLWWANPFMTKRRVTMRVRNFESSKLKVNDHDGNPIEIGAVVVWRVVDSAEAIFQVDNYDNFVHVQSEAALRNLATGHPYDAHNDGQLSLRANTAEVAELLKGEIQARLEKAGVEVIEARISHLAYAPEIANAMLRRQQASAVIAARSKIVEGAVSMVQMALDELSKRGVVTLDEERKAAMVSNLLVVLCSEHETQPIVNAGTLYQG
jgi:regulator of protease activity HflC (stomatin/prohibitin superfamily)